MHDLTLTPTPFIGRSQEIDKRSTLVEEMRDLADGANNLDNKMLSAGMLAFLIAVMDENYAQDTMVGKINVNSRAQAAKFDLLKQD
jgi:hypothetical protein